MTLKECFEQIVQLAHDNDFAIAVALQDEEGCYTHVCTGVSPFTAAMLYEDISDNNTDNLIDQIINN